MARRVFLPISSKDYNIMCEKIYDVYKSILLSNISQESKDIMYIMWKVIFKYVHFLHKYILDCYLKTNGYEVLSSEDGQFYKFNEDAVEKIFVKK